MRKDRRQLLMIEPPPNAPAAARGDATKGRLSRLRLVLAGALARYPEGAGHWACFLQYVFGLRDLGHDVFWLDLLPSTGEGARDERLIHIFLTRFKEYDLQDRCAVLLFKEPEQDLRTARAYGVSQRRLLEIFRSADLLWNFGCSLRQPLLSLFRRRVLVDIDPGHLQVSSLMWDLAIHEHHLFLTNGTKLGDTDCDVPLLGVTWSPFVPSVYLPLWPTALDPDPDAPFSSVTQWYWEELWLKDRVLSVSKRDAYLAYLELPRLTGRPFELAVNLHPRDRTGDRGLLQRHGWRLVHPHRVARTVAGYQRYIQRSRAEFGCPKPIHRELRTGWFSDRSACYLASGRPVLIEDTGLSDHLPTGEGLLVFRDIAEAVAGVTEIERNYARHQRAARRLAEELLDSRRCLAAMLAACGW
jgi:hypothetical protein